MFNYYEYTYYTERTKEKETKRNKKFVGRIYSEKNSIFRTNNAILAEWLRRWSQELSRVQFFHMHVWVVDYQFERA